MDVQQGRDDAGAGTGADELGADPASRSRLGLIVGIALAVLAGLVVTVILLDRDSGGAAAPVTTATTSASVSGTSSGSPSPETSPPAVPSEPADYPDLRADGIDPLELRMTAEQALATGAVAAREVAGMPELVPDPDRYPGVFVSYDADSDLIQAFTVKDGSPITTPDGIGVGSTVDDLREAYGILLQEREENGEVWYLVPVDDVGYAFFPDAQELVLVSATDLVLENLRPGQDL